MSQEVELALHQLGDESQGASKRAVATVLNHLSARRWPRKEFNKRYPPKERQRITGIYGLFRKDELIYIGESVNLMPRLYTHVTGSPDQQAITGVTHLAYIETAPEISLWLIEMRLIRTLAPRGNGRYAKPRKTWGDVRLDELCEVLNVPYSVLYQTLQDHGIERQNFVYNLRDVLTAYGNSKKIYAKC
jgi:hypothetical protein